MEIDYYFTLHDIFDYLLPGIEMLALFHNLNDFNRWLAHNSSAFVKVSGVTLGT